MDQASSFPSVVTGGETACVRWELVAIRKTGSQTHTHTHTHTHTREDRESGRVIGTSFTRFYQNKSSENSPNHQKSTFLILIRHGTDIYELLQIGADPD